MEDRSVSAPQYEVFADEFAVHAENGFHNAFYDRPACLALLGDVAGKRVLDAACGPGHYARELVRRGAQVTGFDQSTRMVALARARASAAEFRVHDLADPITWLPDASVDLVLCALHQGRAHLPARERQPSARNRRQPEQAGPVRAAPGLPSIGHAAGTKDTGQEARLGEAVLRMSCELVIRGVGLDGLEPSTSSLSGKRSNRAELQARVLPAFCPEHAGIDYRKRRPDA